MRATILNDRLAIQTGFAARNLMKELPGARWSKEGQCWTYPLLYPSVLSVGWAATRLRDQVIPATQEVVDWVVSQQEEWQRLAAESKTLISPDAVPGWFGHQVQGAKWLAMPGGNGGRLDVGETGSGKTATSLRAMWHLWTEGDTRPALVSTLVSVKNGWASEIARVAPSLPLPNGAEWRAVVLTGTAVKRRKMLEEVAALAAEGKGAGVVVITNHEMLRMHSRLSSWGTVELKKCPKHGGVREGAVVSEAQCEAHPKEFNAIEWCTFVVDECFVPSALVDTPDGPKEIGSLRVGDMVWGFNEETGELEPTEVKAVMHREAGVVGGFVTPGHPVRVSSGYYPVADLRESDYGITIGHGSVPTLREDVLGSAVEHTPWAEVLFQSVFRGSESLLSGGSGKVSGDDESNSDQSGSTGEVEGAPVRPDQPILGPGSAGTSEGCRVPIHDPGREGTRPDGPTAKVVECSTCGMGPGVHRENGGSEGTGGVVCHRLGEPCSVVGSGGGWELPQGSQGEGAGRPEGRLSGLGRLDGSEVHQPRSPELAGRVPVSDPVPVVNIETGTNNYFVHGLLVHNCHRLMNPKAKMTRAGWAIADKAAHRWGLTGTPGSRNVVENTWALLRLVMGSQWPSKSKWVEYYAEAGYNSEGFWEVGSLKPDHENEFREAYDAVSRRILKKQVLDLPPLLRGGTLIREIPMGKAQAAVYREMEAKLKVMTESGLLTAKNLLVQASRLTGMASATGLLGEVTIEVDEDGEEHEHVSMDLVAPSNKVDALVDMIESGDIEPGTVFQFVSRKLLYLFRDALVKIGVPAYQLGVIAGDVSEQFRDKAKNDFQAGKIPWFAFTVGAGGTGITLTRANTMVAVQRPWSSILHLQAQDRVHRIGSEIHESVSIIDLVTPDTVEIKQLQRLEENAEALEEILKDKDRMAELLFG